MKLNEQGIARARLRMLRAWLTPEQYRQIEAALGHVEAPAHAELCRTLADALRAAGMVFAARFDDARNSGSAQLRADGGRNEQ